MNADHAVEVRELSVRFGRTTALDRLHLSLPAGSIFALVGPNGAGKTTLIKTLLNMHRPSGGHAQVLGLPSTAIHGAALERIGYVSENQELPGWMRLEYFLSCLRPFYPTWDAALEQALLTQLRLPAGRKSGRCRAGSK